MARTLGITLADVVDSGLSIVDSAGLDSLRITGVADALGVKPPSLYSHVDGLGGLLDEMADRATAEFGETLGESVAGHRGDEAIIAFANAYRRWATRYPGRYELTLRPTGDAAARRTAGRGALEAMSELLVGYGLVGADAVRAGRSLRSALHGFVTLEAADNLGRGSHDASFAYLIDLVLAGLRASASSP